jgi:AcrR family transcriptional regulator
MTPKPTKPEPKTYEAHRERQRRRILSAAERLFDEQGIDRTTMAEVIAASELRPSTIYQYFANKDEIVWAILGGLLEEESARVKALLEGLTTGLARITALLEHMADELRNRPAQIRFMAQFDAMYARDWPVERLISLEMHLENHGFEVFRELIRDGIADGSLRKDLDPELTLHAVVNAVIGAQRRLASLGEKVEQEYGQSVEKLFRETIRILIFGLRAEAQADN